MRYHTKSTFNFGGRQYAKGDIVDADVPQSIVERVGLIPIGGQQSDEIKTKTVWKTDAAKRCYSEDPIISVILTFHNQREFVDECIDSFVRQTTDKPYEIIAVDDASTDGTFEYIQRKYPRVRSFRIDEANVGKARNFGRDQARGKYICWFDGDDYVYPEYLEKLHRALLQNPGSGVAYARFDYEPCGLDKGMISACNHFEWSESWLKYQAIINTPSMVERRIAERIEWDPELFTSEDYDVNFQMLEAGANPFHVREPLFKYRVNQKSKWGSGEAIKHRQEDRAHLRKKWGIKLVEAECTMLSLISRPDTLKEYFNGLKKIKMPRGRMHWLVFVDTDDLRLIKKVKEMAVDDRFLSTRVFVTNEKNLETSCNFTDRAMRIARNIRVMVNDAARFNAPTKYVFMVEDDTVAPPDAYERLKSLIEKTGAAMTTGVECARTRDRHMGVGWLKVVEGEIVERLAPRAKTRGVDEVHAAGWYCWVGRVDKIKNVEYRCIEDGRYLGPDVLMAFDLANAGHKVLVDWSVHCKHWDPMIKRFVLPKESPGHRFEYVKINKSRWSMITHKLIE